MPGAGDDRSFFVDRIPAEMVERVEIHPTFGAVTSGDFEGGRILAAINIQDRYRAKEKRSVFRVR